MIEERILFLKNFIKNPRQIGSVTPSSKKLTNKMVEEKSVKNAKCIVELGAGVGCFTQRIIEFKNENTPFIIFEKNEDMRKILKKKYGNYRIEQDAIEIQKLVQDKKMEKPDLIISGLPFTVFKKEEKYKTLENIYEVLEKGGHFVTFQYSLDLKKYLQKKYKKVEIQLVPLNIPMAYIYRCEK